MDNLKTCDLHHCLYKSHNNEFVLVYNPYNLMLYMHVVLVQMKLQLVLYMDMYSQYDLNMHHCIIYNTDLIYYHDISDNLTENYRVHNIMMMNS